MEIREIQFGTVDYIIMGLFLVISTAIGVFFGFFKKQDTTEQYLLGGREMHFLPVAMSLLVTYQSAISVLGVPMEAYVYDTMMMHVYFAIMVANVIQAYLIVPLMYPLRLTSAYEYYGRRFQSRSVELLGTVMGMIQTLLYMSIVLLAPALALEAVAGVPLWMSVIVIGAVGTLYTSIGGIRTVIWTDVFQFVVLYGGLVAILILGIMRVGGLSKMMELAEQGDRIDFTNANPDPRARHTLWSLLIGGVFNWLPNCCNQSAIQRISSMKSARDAKISSLLNAPLVVIYGVLLTLLGLLIYAYFSLNECDPYTAGFISNKNQVVPYFVMHVFWNVPGLSGIFIAALFSGALSSLSSGINSMSANTVQDLLVNVLSDSSQFTKTLVAKLIVILYGAMAVGVAYIARMLSGSVTQLALTAMGAAGGPMVGIVFLGAIFPQANWIGALVGGILGLVVNMWVAAGSVLYGSGQQPSPPIPITGCNSSIPSVNLQDIIGMGLGGTTGNATNYTMMATTTDTWNTSTLLYATDTWNTSTLLTPMQSDGSSHSLFIYDISYLYFGLTGFLLTFIPGIIISVLTGMDRGIPTDSEYIFPCLRGFWKAGYVSVATPKTYKATKQKTGKKGDHLSLPEHTAPIKSLQLAWYNKQPDDEL